MLSYNHLYDYVRRERNHQDVQELPSTFYNEVQLFFNTLQDAIASGSLLEAESLRTQLVNAKKLFKQLYEYREQKIMHLAQNKCRTGSHLIDTTKLLEDEKQLFDELIAVLSAQRVHLAVADDASLTSRNIPHVRDSVVTGQLNVPEQKTIERITVRVIKAVPQFLGTGMEPFGPFEEDECVELPSTVAHVLIRKGTAKEE